MVPMTIVAISVFAFSVVGILALFLMKKLELSRGSLYGGVWRDEADLFAMRVKWVFLVVEWYLARLPDFLFLLSRYGVRNGALHAARLARYAETQAYRLADFVSHKRNFERRETKSNYLKQVSEHPMRSQNGSHGAGKNDGGPVATV